MRFLADENIPLPSVRRLREAGHEVLSVSELSPGISDEAVLAWAHREQLLLLTSDRDYGSLIFERGQKAGLGVIYFRLVPSTPEELAERLLGLLRPPEVDLVGNLTVVSRDGIRQRKYLAT